jgi:hypothetical protein
MSVFANGLEVSGKATPNKTIAAMPDVCLSPPPPPAGPVPIPYPLTGMASDTTDGCTSVFVKGKEAGRKNSTKYSKTTGNEPATNSFGANIITHKITGPLKFAAYSFDVIFEGGGATRFTDITTQNHMNTGGGSFGVSGAGASPPSPATPADCAKMRTDLQNDRKEVKKSIAAKDSGFESAKLIADVESATASTGMVTGGNQISGASNQLYADRLDYGADGGSKYDTKTLKDYKAYQPTKSLACSHDGKEPLMHPSGRHSRHAEMNILNKIDWKNPPAAITFAIDYPNKSKQYEDDMPCPTCDDFIRQACRCIQIYVCDPKTNQPKSQCPPPKKK